MCNRRSRGFDWHCLFVLNSCLGARFCFWLSPVTGNVFPKTLHQKLRGLAHDGVLHFLQIILDLVQTIDQLLKLLRHCAE